MPLPTVFYKYTSIEVAALVLDSIRLWWSSPLIFNDLSDSRRLPRLKPPLSEALRQIPSISLKAASGSAVLGEARPNPQARNFLSTLRSMGLSEASSSYVTSALITDTAGQPDAQFADFIRQVPDRLNLTSVRVLCVTTDYDNDAMWSSYADRHSGCVLGFRHVPAPNTRLLRAQQVEYTEKAPVVDSGLDFLLFGLTNDLLNASLKAICLSKRLPWSYEREWRAITFSEDSSETFSDIPFKPEELESVTLGPRVRLTGLMAVCALVKRHYKDCTIYRLRECEGDVSRVPVV